MRIELYDRERLEPRRDRSLPLAGGALALVLVGLVGYAYTLQQRLGRIESANRDLEARLQKAAATRSPSSTLAADLQRQLEKAEADAGMAGTEGSGTDFAASQWLQRLTLLAAPEVSLLRIEVERSGSARIEGLATSPQAVSAFVQAWERQERLAAVHPRSIEVQQDKSAAPYLRFNLRAMLPGGRT